MEPPDPTAPAPLPPAERVTAAAVAAEAATTAASASTDAASAKAAVAAAGDALMAHGRRTINKLWEYTQAGIAWMVMITVCAESLLEIIDPALLAIAGSIIGQYFTRTNHSASGGVGPITERRGE